MSTDGIEMARADLQEAWYTDNPHLAKSYRYQALVHAVLAIAEELQRLNERAEANVKENTK